MKNFRLMLVAGAFGALLLSACGSPADKLTFKAPPGWGEPKNIFGMAQIWTSSDGNSALMLFKFPVQVDQNTAMQKSGFKDATVKKKEQIRVCGNQPATHIAMTGTGSRRQDVDMVMTNTLGSTYMTMYARPVGAKPDAAAESAIRSACAAK